MPIHEFHHLQWVMLTGFVTEWLYVKRVTGTFIRILNNACSPYSAQLRCKLFLIIRNSSLVKVLILTIFNAVTLQKVTVKQISTLLARKVSKPFSAQNRFSWCKSCFSHLFMAACRAHICLESFINTIKLDVERQIASSLILKHFIQIRL